MLKITYEEVKKVAKLAHITLYDQEMLSYQKELNSILNMASKLQDLDIVNVTHLVNTVSDNVSMREDAAQNLEILRPLLSNAPESKYGCFSVPKVIE